MPKPVLIAHARSEEDIAELLVQPLTEAGYEASYQGAVQVGESVIHEMSKALENGTAVVLCGTQRAAGNKFVQQLVNAARSTNGILFILQIEQDADLDRFAFGEKIARYWQNPAIAIKELIASLHKRYPPTGTPTTVERGSAAERHYRDRLLASSDIINLANLPRQDRQHAHNAQQLKLRSVFIPLRVRVEAAVDKNGLQDETIWASLEERRAAAVGGRTLVDTRQVVGFPVGERLDRARRLVVLGDPGAGKTTLIRWIATAYLLRSKDSRQWQEIPDVKTLPDADWLPIIIRCRDLDSDAVAGSLDDMLKCVLRRAELGDQESTILRELLRSRIEDGSALLMLDGLDEITESSTRARFCEQIERIVDAYPSAPIIATSRVVGYREMGYKLGRAFEHVTLADLTNESKDDFAKRWTLLNEVPEVWESEARQLIQFLRSERIERLTGNPMLLMTLAQVRSTLRKLPKHRADLYWEAFYVLLNWRSEVDEPLDWGEALPTT
jgi:predicted NACHT family NTPase